MPEESYNPSSDPFPQGSDDAASEGLGSFPPEPTAESEADSSSRGNRPASGARQVDPGEVFTQDFFTGSENAGDFLGLDEDFTESWSGGSGLELQGAPKAGPEASPPAMEGSASDLMGAEEDYPFEDDGQVVQVGDDIYDEEHAGEEVYAEEGEFADGELEPGGFEEGEFAAEGIFGEGDDEFAAPRSKKGLLVAAVVVVALAGAGWKFGPQLLDSGGGAVATNDPRPTPPPVDPVDVDPLVDPSGGVDLVVLDPVDVDPVDVDPVDPVVDPTGGEDPLTQDPEAWIRDPDPVDVVQGGEDPVDLFTGLENILPGGQDAAPGDPLTQATSQIASLFGLGPAAPTGSFPDFASGEFEWASEDLLDLVWRGTEVPMEAISAPARTLMPRVGDVRVHMRSGETFDGRLYAVGQHRVWIEGPPGRIGLDGEEVDHFERLVMAASSGGPTPTGGRVRVRVPGGVLYGRILAVNGNQVTLVSEDGGKITLDDPEMEPLGSNRPIVVSQ